MRVLIFIGSLVFFQICRAQPPYGEWGPPINLGAPINSEFAEMRPTINAAGDVLAMVAHRPNPLLQGVFISRLIDGYWSEPVYIFSVGDQPNIEPALSPDGNELYFSCYCGGYGDYDIWKVIYNDTTQTWSSPINLGPNINDEWGQAAPFISYNAQHLYYLNASPRFPNWGLVVSNRDSNDWNYPEWVDDYMEFSESASLTLDETEVYFKKAVVNIGYQVFYSYKNTDEYWVEPQLFYPINNYCIADQPVVTADGNTIYFSGTIDGGLGGSDIWRIERLVGLNEENNSIADNFIVQIYPNPFNATTSIKYSLSKSGPVNLSIYNLLGQKVATLFEGVQAAGEHSIIWDAGRFSSGIYFARLSTNDDSKNIRMVLLK